MARPVRPFGRREIDFFDEIRLGTAVPRNCAAQRHGLKWRFVRERIYARFPQGDRVFKECSSREDIVKLCGTAERRMQLQRKRKSRGNCMRCGGSMVGRDAAKRMCGKCCAEVTRLASDFTIPE